MNQKDLATPSGIFISLFIFGLGIAIFIQTGVSINPEDILLDIGRIIFEELGGEYSVMWTIFTIAMTFISIISLLAGFYLIYQKGIISIIIAICGGLSGSLIFFKPTVYIGIGAMLFGMFMVSFLEV